MLNPQFGDGPEPITDFAIPVGQWSDGTAVSKTACITLPTSSPRPLLNSSNGMPPCGDGQNAMRSKRTEFENRQDKTNLRPIGVRRSGAVLSTRTRRVLRRNQ